SARHESVAGARGARGLRCARVRASRSTGRDASGINPGGNDGTLLTRPKPRCLPNLIRRGLLVLVTDDENPVDTVEPGTTVEMPERFGRRPAGRSRVRQVTDRSMTGLRCPLDPADRYPAAPAPLLRRNFLFFLLTSLPFCDRPASGPAIGHGAVVRSRCDNTGFAARGQDQRSSPVSNVRQAGGTT